MDTTVPPGLEALLSVEELAAARTLQDDGRQAYQATRDEVDVLIAAADGDDVALVEACAEVGRMALKKRGRPTLAVAADVLHRASDRARYDEKRSTQRRGDP